MNDLETTKTNEQTEAGTRAPQREWVTPSFEQVALKDALGSLGKFQPLDLVGLSS